MQGLNLSIYGVSPIVIRHGQSTDTVPLFLSLIHVENSCNASAVVVFHPVALRGVSLSLSDQIREAAAFHPVALRGVSLSLSDQIREAAALKAQIMKHRRKRMNDE